MKFCSECGSDTLQFNIPQGDNRPRYCCPDCNTIHYQNPKIIVGAVPVWQDKVLLCKRAIEPRKGYWTLPAGFMENGETLQEGAARETWEEACATVEMGDLYTVFNLPHIYQVYVFFLGKIADGQYGVGEESSDAALFRENEIPWDEIAFPTVGRTLKYFFRDRNRLQKNNAQGENGGSTDNATLSSSDDYPVRVQDIAPLGRKPSED